MLVEVGIRAMRPVEMYEAVWEKSLALNVLQANKNGYERGLEA